MGSREWRGAGRGEVGGPGPTTEIARGLCPSVEQRSRPAETQLDRGAARLGAGRGARAAPHAWAQMELRGRRLGGEAHPGEQGRAGGA